MYYLSFVHGMYISCTLHVHLVVSFALPFVPSVAPWSGAITARNMTLPYSSNVTWSRPFGINNGTTLNRTASRSLKGSRPLGLTTAQPLTAPVAGHSRVRDHQPQSSTGTWAIVMATVVLWAIVLASWTAPTLNCLHVFLDIVSTVCVYCTLNVHSQSLFLY